MKTGAWGLSNSVQVMGAEATDLSDTSGQNVDIKVFKHRHTRTHTTTSTLISLLGSRAP